MSVPEAGWPLTAAALRAARRRADPLRWIAPVRGWQVVTWEVALLAVAFTVDQARPVTVAAVAFAGSVILLTSVRIGGCCLAQWGCTLAGYRRRRRLAARRQHRGRSAAGRPADLLTELLPDLRLREHVDRAGNRVGLAVFGDGLTTVVRLAPATRPDLGILLAVLRDAFTSSAIPLAGAQLVVWTVAAPPQPGHAVKDPARVYWLAVRYRPGQAPHATLARGGGEIGAMRAAASAALGLAVALDDAGYPCAVLDRLALGQELRVALGAAGGAVPAAAAGARETWRAWSADGVRQVCYLPGRGLGLAELLERWVPSAAFSCVSYTVGRTARGHLRDEVVVRLADAATRARAPAPGSAFGRHPVPTTGRNHRYILRTLPLVVGR